MSLTFGSTTSRLQTCHMQVSRVVRQEMRRKIANHPKGQVLLPPSLPTSWGGVVSSVAESFLPLLEALFLALRAYASVGHARDT